MSHSHFILTHKSDFTFPLDCHEKPEDFTIISENPVKCTFIFENQNRAPVVKEGTVVKGVNNWQLGEIPAWTYIVSVLKDGDTATLHHYRRKLLGTGQGVYGHAAYLKFPMDVMLQTAYYHSSTMVNLLRKVLPKEYSDSLSKSTLFAPYNLFYADKATIQQWLNFQNFYIKKMVDITGPDIEYWLRTDYAERGGDTYTPRQGKNISVNYQRRFYAFISERLNTIFWNIKETEYWKKHNEILARHKKEGTEMLNKEIYENGATIVFSVQLLEQDQKI